MYVSFRGIQLRYIGVGFCFAEENFTRKLFGSENLADQSVAPINYTFSKYETDI